MNKLWAPWRMEYILSDKKDRCVFCEAVSSREDKKHLVVYRGSLSFVILNRYPYNSGHLMVVPNRHVGDIVGLEVGERNEMFELVGFVVDLLRRVMSPDGFNIGMNLGSVSGAGIDDHIHVHVVPRWNGDTNFMPVIADTKVISDSLENVYKRLTEELGVR